MRQIAYPTLEDSAIVELIGQRESFHVVGCRGKFKQAVSRVEATIEACGLTCRVRTAGRVAAVAAGLFNPVYAVAASVGILGHRLLTIDPDYEVVKHMVDRRIEVLYVSE